LRQSQVFRDLRRGRNLKPLLSHFGGLIGGALGLADLWMAQATGLHPFGTLRHRKADHESLHPVGRRKAPPPPRPDGATVLDIPTSLYLSGTNHEENQPVHLKLADPGIPQRVNLPEYGEPALRYCPGGVFTLDPGALDGGLHIDAVRCLHCKTCDIKDPSQNLIWTPPEGGGGPNYVNL